MRETSDLPPLSSFISICVVYRSPHIASCPLASCPPSAVIYPRVPMDVVISPFAAMVEISERIPSPIVPGCLFFFLETKSPPWIPFLPNSKSFHTSGHLPLLHDNLFLFPKIPSKFLYLAVISSLWWLQVSCKIKHKIEVRNHVIGNIIK